MDPVPETRGAAGGRSSNIIIIISVRRERPTPPVQCGFDRAVGERPRTSCAHRAPPTAPSPPAPRRPHQRSAPNARAPSFAANRKSLKWNRRRRRRRSAAAARRRSAWRSAALGSAPPRARDVCAITVYAALAHPQNQLSICRTYLSSSSRRTVGANGQAGSSNGAYRVH